MGCPFASLPGPAQPASLRVQCCQLFPVPPLLLVLILLSLRLQSLMTGTPGSKELLSQLVANHRLQLWSGDSAVPGCPVPRSCPAALQQPVQPLAPARGRYFQVRQKSGSVLMLLDGDLHGDDRATNWQSIGSQQRLSQGGTQTTRTDHGIQNGYV